MLVLLQVEDIANDTKSTGHHVSMSAYGASYRIPYMICIMISSSFPVFELPTRLRSYASGVRFKPNVLGSLATADESACIWPQFSVIPGEQIEVMLSLGKDQLPYVSARGSCVPFKEGGDLGSDAGS